MVALDKITVYNPLFVVGFDFRDGLVRYWEVIKVFLQEVAFDIKLLN